MVLMGGPGSEREVSLVSGRAVADALQSRGHRVTRVDLRPEDTRPLAETDVDAVFIAMHGTFGEDGQVQALLDRYGLAYVGSGPRASALGMDKAAAKRLFTLNGVPTAPGQVVEAGGEREAAGLWQAPVVVKPVAEGSSVGVSIVRQTERIEPTLREATARHGRCLIERFIDGYELTVGILGERALPVCHIQSRTEFYDYHAKYKADDTQYSFEIDLPGELLARIQSLSLAAHKALGCRDLGRVDWMVDRQTLEPFCLEVNTIPGFTDHSLLPKAAAQAGIPFPVLCEHLVEMAIRRKQQAPA